jgi:hypothetical protein
MTTGCIDLRVIPRVAGTMRTVLAGIALLEICALRTVRADDDDEAPKQIAAAHEPRPRGILGAPSDADYVTWLHGQPKGIQLSIGRFCSAHPLTYEADCGGIGPLHIPPPPEQVSCAGVPRARFPGGPRTRTAWLNSLTAGQQKYVAQKCRLGRHAGSELCQYPEPKHCNTPLVVSFDDRPVTFAPGARFSFAPGVATATDWPTATTPWIAIDLDGDGAITSGAELFGSNTKLPTGGTADNGFTALAALDANHDGKIDRDDPGFAKLVLWSGMALEPLSRSIVSISLASRAAARCDARGNCEGLRATMTWRDAAGLHTGSVIDVYLPAR